MVLLILSRILPNEIAKVISTIYYNDIKSELYKKQVSLIIEAIKKSDLVMLKRFIDKCKSLNIYSSNLSLFITGWLLDFEWHQLSNIYDPTKTISIKLQEELRALDHPDYISHWGGKDVLTSEYYLFGLNFRNLTLDQISTLEELPKEYYVNQV